MHLADIAEREQSSEDHPRQPSDPWKQPRSSADPVEPTRVSQLPTVEEVSTPVLVDTPTLGPSVPPPSAATIHSFGQPSPSSSLRPDSYLNGGPEADLTPKPVAPSPPPEPTVTSIYVSVGRETKKASLEPDQMPPTLASLRLIFLDKFSYDSGLEDFPAIYIRDPRLGVEYELEDCAEVRDGCVLSLNVERKSADEEFVSRLIARSSGPSQATHRLWPLHIDAGHQGPEDGSPVGRETNLCAASACAYRRTRAPVSRNHSYTPASTTFHLRVSSRVTSSCLSPSIRHQRLL
jgi:hypothetical protein